MIVQEYTKCHIRWMIERDMQKVIANEAEAFGDMAWNEEEFRKARRGRNQLCLIAEVGEKIVGHMAFKLCDRSIKLLNFCVHPDRTREGIGEQMLRSLKSRLSRDHRFRISVIISEACVKTLNWFRSQGFLAVDLLHDYYTAKQLDGIKMEYILEDADQSTPPPFVDEEFWEKNGLLENDPPV